MEDHETRRRIIRQWMALPKDKRQTAEQAAAFAERAVQQNELQRSRLDPHQRGTGWLLPRVGRAWARSQLGRWHSSRADTRLRPFDFCDQSLHPTASWSPSHVRGQLKVKSVDPLWKRTRRDRLTRLEPAALEKLGNGKGPMQSPKNSLNARLNRAPF